MDSTDTTTDDLELEDSTADRDDDQEADLGASEDEGEIAYDDRLSEVLVDRIRAVVPRHTLYAGAAGHGYIECLTERPERLSDDVTVDQVGIALVGEDLAPKAQELRGILDGQYVAGGQLLELAYRHTGTEWVYTLTLDGTYVKGFRSLALAKVAYDLLVDRKPEAYGRTIARIIELFYRLVSSFGEDAAETCSSGFTDLIAHRILDP